MAPESQGEGGTRVGHLKGPVLGLVMKLTQDGHLEEPCRRSCLDLVNDPNGYQIWGLTAAFAKYGVRERKTGLTAAFFEAPVSSIESPDGSRYECKRQQGGRGWGGGGG